jgi:primase-polymerase (primpol)-like protein
MTWRSFEEAMQALQNGRYSGVGFVFSSGDPFAAIDLDAVRDPQTGQLEEWAAEIIRDLNGYAEVSPSGKGVHVIVRGKAPNKRRGKVEAYSSARFFTMSGRVL